MNSGGLKIMGNRGKSDVWGFFELLNSELADPEEKSLIALAGERYECRFCHSILVNSKQSATRLKDHLRKCPSCPPLVREVLFVDEEEQPPQPLGTYVKCSVPCCQSYFEVGNPKYVGFSHFPFPDDPELRMAWIRVIGKSEDWDPSGSMICCAHFDSKSFVTKPPKEVTDMGSGPALLAKRGLRAGAIPSTNLGIVANSIGVKFPGSQRPILPRPINMAMTPSSYSSYEEEDDDDDDGPVLHLEPSVIITEGPEIEEKRSPPAPPTPPPPPPPTQSHKDKSKTAKAEVVPENEVKPEEKNKEVKKRSSRQRSRPQRNPPDSSPVLVGRKRRGRPPKRPLDTSKGSGVGFQEQKSGSSENGYSTNELLPPFKILNLGKRKRGRPKKEGSVQRTRGKRERTRQKVAAAAVISAQPQLLPPTSPSSPPKIVKKESKETSPPPALAVENAGKDDDERIEELECKIDPEHILQYDDEDEEEEVEERRPTVEEQRAAAAAVAPERMIQTDSKGISIAATPINGRPAAIIVNGWHGGVASSFILEQLRPGRPAQLSSIIPRPVDLDWNFFLSHTEKISRLGPEAKAELMETFVNKLNQLLERSAANPTPPPPQTPPMTITPLTLPPSTSA